ncbi:hypothetical protein Tco_0481877 [Tanacetum coccineum]
MQEGKMPSFLPSDDPIESLNKSMTFLRFIITSRYPQTNNQLRTSSNPRNQQDTSSRSGNDTDALDADIRLVSDKEPRAEVQLTAEHNVLANEQQHTEQSEPIYDTYLLEKVDSNTTHDSTNMSNRGGEINQNAEKCQVTSPLLDPLTQPNTSEQSCQAQWYLSAHITGDQKNCLKEEDTRQDYGTKRGRHSTSLSSAFGQPSYSHLKDEEHDRLRSIEKSIKNLLKGKKKNDEDDTTTPSLITKSSSPSPPNAPSKTLSTKDTSSTFGTTSSSFESKAQSSPPFSNDTTSPQPSNPFLNDIMDAPLIPSNSILLQSHPSLDITLSLSPITPLDHILNTASPLSPQPPPQQPLMGHPIYFNYHDYHGSTCLCCFHNQNLFFTLGDDMNLMFAHLEYLLTSSITSPSPPYP